jgi:hypothetical protein
VGPTFILQIEFCEPVTIALTRKKKKNEFISHVVREKVSLKGKIKLGKKEKVERSLNG